MPNFTRKILLIGGGLTSAFTACLLRNSSINASIYVYEKSSDVGGRMRTFRKSDDAFSKVDLGAQFITASPNYIREHAQFYQMLLEANLLKPLSKEIKGLEKGEPGTLHFLAPQGTGAIVRHLWNLSGSIIFLDTEVMEISLSSGQWVVMDTKQCREVFDSVVLTMPVPEMIKLQGTVQQLLKDQELELGEVSYSSRYALGLFFPRETAPNLSLPYKAYFLDEDPIRYVSFDPGAAVVHSSAGYKPKNLALAECEMKNHFAQQFPNLPPPQSSLAHYWKCSQVVKPHPKAKGCLVLHPDPLLICGGDAFSHSSFDGCLDSAIVLAEHLLTSHSIAPRPQTPHRHESCY